MNAETLTIGGTDYELKQRLGWFEQAEIDERDLRLLTDGQSLAQVGQDDIAALEHIEIVMTPARHNLARLEARLVSIDGQRANRRSIKSIPPAHITTLLSRISEFEQAQRREAEELTPGNPTETLSGA